VDDLKGNDFVKIGDETFKHLTDFNTPDISSLLKDMLDNSYNNPVLRDMTRLNSNVDYKIEPKPTAKQIQELVSINKSYLYEIQKSNEMIIELRDIVDSLNNELDNERKSKIKSEKKASKYGTILTIVTIIISIAAIVIPIILKI
jgi:methionyl-tRNA synthetase